MHPISNLVNTLLYCVQHGVITRDYFKSTLSDFDFHVAFSKDGKNKNLQLLIFYRRVVQEA